MSRRAPDLPSNCPSWVVAVPPPVSRPPCHGEPRSCEQRPSTGDGSSTARLTSSMSRRAPDLASNDPSWAVAVPPPVSRPPHHGEPQSREQRPSTGGGSSPARLASRLAPGLASNDPAQAVAVPPPISRPPRHGEPPNIVSKDPAWVVELPLPVLHPHCGEASILFTFRIQISLLKVYTKYKINYITRNEKCPGRNEKYPRQGNEKYPGRNEKYPGKGMKYPRQGNEKPQAGMKNAQAG